MRVAFVAHQFFPSYYTGVERITLNLVRQLALIGHECVVVAPADRSSGGTTAYAVDGARVRPVAAPRADLARPWLPAPRAGGGELGRVLDEERVEVVHVMHPMRLPYAFAESERRRLPVVAHLPDFTYLCARINMLRLDGTLCPGAEGGNACVGVKMPLTMPPIRITGVSSGRNPSRSDDTTAAKLKRAPRGMLWRSANMATQIMSAAPIRSPGTSPATSMPPTETFAMSA